MDPGAPHGGSPCSLADAGDRCQSEGAPPSRSTRRGWRAGSSCCCALAEASGAWPTVLRCGEGAPLDGTARHEWLRRRDEPAV